ncbi:hypothetical protein OLMES_4904 [Oleiphilus messinensis]|uniref:YceK/YidQ family lipoprotein n=2 Tax=Oleiphilus messinensis TaxID=141451 RepID=A0A1Y0IEF3_9GAMM|nr:hypothetical protein OLMES_4904 [Oleiphilus messinensis]
MPMPMPMPMLGYEMILGGNMVHKTQTILILILYMSVMGCSTIKVHIDTPTRQLIPYQGTYHSVELAQDSLANYQMYGEFQLQINNLISSLLLDTVVLPYDLLAPIIVSTCHPDIENGVK